MSSSSDLSISPHVRSCDVFISHCFSRHRHADALRYRFAKWLCAELEMQGIYCYLSDRRKCANDLSHSIARTAMDRASVGIVVVSEKSLCNPYSMEELQKFSESGKLVPVFFGLTQAECCVRDVVEQRGTVWEKHGGRLWKNYGGLEEDWRETVDRLSQAETMVEANVRNMRDSVLQTIVLIGKKLGKRGIEEYVGRWKEMAAAEEFPFLRSTYFVGREKELLELEMLLCGDVEKNDPKNFRMGFHDQNSSAAESSTNWRSTSSAVGARLANEIEERLRKGKAVVGDHEVMRMKAIVSPQRLDFVRKRKKKSLSELFYGDGIACVSGDSGIGKTELLIEFAYRFAQRYKMVLWIGGEAKHICRNYMKLLPFLGVYSVTGNEVFNGKHKPRKIEDVEAAAISKVRSELSRDIPFLLIIDNLEAEKDWWTGRSILELLPFSEGRSRKTHVLISTRLEHVANIRPLKLPFLSAVEALTLMSPREVVSEDVNALRRIEEKLGRLPFALAIVDSILSELSFDPWKLLRMIEEVDDKSFDWDSEEQVLRQNPFIDRLLELCFSVICNSNKLGILASRMVAISKWFGPSPIPTSMLAMSAQISTRHNSSCVHVWKNLRRTMSHLCTTTSEPELLIEAEAFTMLVRFRLAKIVPKMGSIQIHRLAKIYAGKQQKARDAEAVVQVIMKKALVLFHADHITAACVLLFKFGTEESAVVKLNAIDLMNFVQRLALPLAIHYFRDLSLCTAALELLRSATEALEQAENNSISDLGNSSNKRSSGFSCCSRKQASELSIDPQVYKEFANLRATLLETRAKFLIRGGVYDSSDQLCRSSVSIREVIYGSEHPMTISTRKTMDRMTRMS